MFENEIKIGITHRSVHSSLTLRFLREIFGDISRSFDLFPLAGKSLEYNFGLCVNIGVLVLKLGSGGGVCSNNLSRCTGLVINSLPDV
ncbi:hypothetical protein ALC57_04883 [Trachymyrmex cornetzi]|uniref:Uncharacterized protein n=1 Tax=Trachymyrmex cornetzi TaxID=471704 RepID=A0A195ED20_9HYME|nr:hypothetical protein ALC57_04883 [Trachymyrmex cornetzi]